MAAWMLRLIFPVPGMPPWFTQTRPAVNEMDWSLVVSNAVTVEDAMEQADKAAEEKGMGPYPGGVEHPWKSKVFCQATRLSE